MTYPALRLAASTFVLALVSVLALTATITVIAVATRTPEPDADPTVSVETPAVVSPDQFGAIGDGSHDDTLAIQAALDALRPGQTLSVPEGQIFRHTSVLHIRREGVRIVGPGVLRATAEATSAVSVEADGVTLEGNLVLEMAETTKRWAGSEQNKLTIENVRRTVVRDVVVAGGAAAGIYIGQSSEFAIVDVEVRDTRSDGIHITGSSHDGWVARPHAVRTGDDGVAVVSYGHDGEPVRNVFVDSPVVEQSRGGRGVAVVGGEDITFRDVRVSGSRAAAVYVAAEPGPYNTLAPVRVRVLGGVLTGSNTFDGVAHGAVMVYSGRPGYPVVDVQISDLQIADTRPGAPWQIGVIGPGGFSQVRLANIAISGGPPHILTTHAGDALTTAGVTGLPG